MGHPLTQKEEMTTARSFFLQALGAFPIFALNLSDEKS